MAVWHPEGMDCLSWEEEVKRETEEVLQEVTGQAEQEQGLKSEDPDLDGSVDPYDDTNLVFEVDGEGNVCPSDVSSDGSLLDLGVSLLSLNRSRLSFCFPGYGGLLQWRWGGPVCPPGYRCSGVWGRG